MNKLSSALACLFLTATVAMGQETQAGRRGDTQARGQAAAYTAAYNICLADCQASLIQRSQSKNDPETLQQYNTATKLAQVFLQQSESQPSWVRQATDYQKALAQFAFPNQEGGAGGTQEGANATSILQVVDINRAVQDAINAISVQHRMPTAQLDQQNQTTCREMVRQLLDTAAQDISRAKTNIQRQGGNGQSKQLNQVIQTAEQLVTQLHQQYQQQSQTQQTRQQ